MGQTHMQYVRRLAHIQASRSIHAWIGPDAHAIHAQARSHPGVPQHPRMDSEAVGGFRGSSSLFMQLIWVMDFHAVDAAVHVTVGC